MISRSAGRFAGRCASRSRSGVRPTLTRRTSRWTSRSPILTVTIGETPAGVGRTSTGQVERIDDRVALLLPRVRRERLPEEPLAVEDPDADEGHAEVARGLEVVAREDAEAARVDRQHLGQPELRAEVRDAVASRRERRDPGVRGRRRVLGREGVGGGLHPRDVVRVRRERGEARRVDDAQEQDRIAGAVPFLRIELPEEGARVRAPRPAHVAGEVGEGRELGRKGRRGAVRSQRSHRRAEDNRSAHGFIARTVRTAASRSATCGSYGL